MDSFHLISSVVTPVRGLLGGLGLAISSAILLYANGETFGISGFIHRTFQLSVNDSYLYRLRNILSFMGLVLGGFLVGVFEQTLGINQPPSMSFPEGASTLALVKVGVAGFLTGLGSRLQNGCTSGHMICGISRFSQR